MTGSRGIAQLLVLWTLVLLGALAAGFSLAMRTEAQASRYAIDDARAYYQARSGVSRAIMLLSTLPADNVARMEIAGKEGDASYAVHVENESGKVDINFVSEDDLLEILKMGGMKEEVAEAMRDAILDWKDADDNPRPRGAEASGYASLPEPVRPRNGNLLHVGELRYVLGVTSEFYDAFLSRVFTVRGNSSQVNVLHAPGIVLESLPDVSKDAAEEILFRRGADSSVSPTDLAEMTGRGLLTPKGLAMISGKQKSKVYTITATGYAGAGVIHTVRCSVEVVGTGKTAVKVVGWLDLVSGEGEK